MEALENEVELERGRGRQGLLPDFKMEIPSPAGEPIQRLAELKIIGAVPKWYLRSDGLGRKKKVPRDSAWAGRPPCKKTSRLWPASLSDNGLIPGREQRPAPSP